ncbi:MAG: hypothetical protein AAF539_07210 [Planctomycetota bacterium]
MSQSNSKHSLPIDSGEPPPSFGCLIYLRHIDNGGVHARIANLSGVEVSAPDERAALSKIVPMFRQKMAEAAENGTSLQLDPEPPPPDAGEIRRFLPVHL